MFIFIKGANNSGVDHTLEMDFFLIESDPVESNKELTVMYLLSHTPSHHLHSRCVSHRHFSLTSIHCAAL